MREYKEMYKRYIYMNSTIECSRDSWKSMLPLRTLISNREKPRSKLHDLNVRSRGVSDTPQASMIQCQVAKQGKHNMNITKDIKFRKQGLEHKYRRYERVQHKYQNQEIQGIADYMQD